MLANMDAPPSVDTDSFSNEELLIFSKARAAGDVRRSFDQWVLVGFALVLARKHADAAGGHVKARRARAKAILNEHGLAWAAGSSRLLQVMDKLDAVEAWRATLTDVERARWNSPQAVWNKCGAFHPYGQTVGPPKIKAHPMLVSELVMLKADDIALLFYRRDASKAWALRRSLDALLDGTPKPKSGWAAARDRAAAGASVAA